MLSDISVKIKTTGDGEIHSYVSNDYAYISISGKPPEPKTALEKFEKWTCKKDNETSIQRSVNIFKAILEEKVLTDFQRKILKELFVSFKLMIKSDSLNGADNRSKNTVTSS